VADGNYRVVGTLVNEICREQVVYDLNIIELNIPNVLTRNNDGINDILKINSATPVGLTIYTRWGTKVFEAEEYANDWRGAELQTGIYFYEAKLINGEVCSGWIQLLNDN
jgi:gliding motility-associated-like protein